MRPDHHVAWRAKKRSSDAADELGGVFASLLGKPSKAAKETDRLSGRAIEWPNEAIYFSEEESEAAVISRMDPEKVDPRLLEVTKSLVRHLHAFVKEVEPTNEEWMTGIKF